MTWLGGRMKWPFGGNSAAVAELEPEPEIENVDDGKPRLMMLAADASGLASFKLFNFRDSDEAVDFIQRSFGDRSDTGLIAFWAMTEKPVVSPQPGADTALEVMVMIRDDSRNDVVYPFSFTSIETAHGFVQHEMQRGLDPNHVLLYWAVPVQLGISAAGEAGLFPKAAPTEVEQDTHEIARAPLQEGAPEASDPGDLMQSLTISVAVEEPFVSSEDDPIEEMFASAERPVAEAAAEITQLEEAIEEFAGGGDETNLEETAEVIAEQAELTEEDESESDTPVIAEDAEVVAADVVENESAEEEIIEAPAEETTVEETTEDWNETDETFGSTEAVEEAREPVAAIAIEQWVSDGPMGTEFAAGRAYARSAGESNDVSDQLQRVLRVRRWEESTEPFRGFQSPPGRF